jgi:hypothetical protein
VCRVPIPGKRWFCAFLAVPVIASVLLFSHHVEQRSISRAARLYLRAFVAGDSAAAAPVAAGAALAMVHTVQDNHGGPGADPEILIHDVVVSHGLATVTATVDLPGTDKPEAHIPLFLQLRLATADQTWQVYGVDPIDPPAGSWLAAWKPFGSDDRRALVDSVQQWLDATATGDLSTAATYLAGRAWLAGEANRQALDGRPILPDGKPADLSVTVLHYREPAAQVLVDYKLPAGPVRLLVQMYRAEREGGPDHGPLWRLARTDLLCGPGAPSGSLCPR